MPLDTKVGLGTGRVVLHGDPAPPSQKGHSPQFSAMSFVVKRSRISATAEHLSKFFNRRLVSKFVKYSITRQMRRYTL